MFLISETNVGIIPLLTVAIAFVLNIQMMFYIKLKVPETWILSLGVSTLNSQTD
jgi:hypothetical protein